MSDGSISHAAERINDGNNDQNGEIQRHVQIAQRVIKGDIDDLSDEELNNLRKTHRHGRFL